MRRNRTSGIEGRLKRAAARTGWPLFICIELSHIDITHLYSINTVVGSAHRGTDLVTNTVEYRE